MISHRIVPPSGPLDAKVYAVGEGPGVEEDRRGKGFVGKSGMVFWEMLKDYTGLTRKDVRLDNLMLHRHTDAKGKDRGPTPEEFNKYAPELRARIKTVAPRLIVTLGRYSTRAVLRRDLTMEAANGCLYRGVVIPVTHPAAGLHQPEMLAATEYGLRAVGAFLRWSKADDVARKVAKSLPARYDSSPPHPSYGLLIPEDKYPVPHYSKHVHAPTLPGVPVLSNEIALDTEYDPVDGTPWCLTWTGTEGVGRMIRADDDVTLDVFRRALETHRPTIILHNALADLRPLRVMGIDLLIMGLKIRDTMIESFVTQRHPRALKPLATRLAGMEMQDYAEVVGPVEEAFARAYLETALAEPEAAWCLPPPAEPRKHSIVRRLEGMLAPVQRVGAEEPRTIREKWEDRDNFGAVREAIEKVHGPMPRPGLDDMPEEEFRVYACRDPDATLRVSRPLHRQVQHDDLGRVLGVDLGVLPLVDRMQQIGMLVDVRKLDELRDFVAGATASCLRSVRGLVGDPDFNPGSGDQVAAWCRDADLGLEKRTKSRKREQVDENALTLIRFKHPGVEAILRYRELDKLRGTYIEPLYGFLRGTGRYRRLFGNFRLTSAVTGRLSMHDPNLMAFPTRTDLGRRVRECFVAGPGRVIGSCDLSQIELRVGAGLSQDPAMMKAFRAGVDLHTRTAAKFFHHDDSPRGMGLVTKTERAVIKVPNFGILFGAREHRMESEFLRAGIEGYDLAACKDMIDWWFTEYAGVETWIDEHLAQGRREGFVTTPAGRRRYVPALRFPSDEYPFNRLREEAERQAVNFPVQGGAQEIEKTGMRVVHEDVLPAVHAAGYYAEPLLQIHDELLFEVDEDGADLLGELAVEAMTREGPWRGVPLGASWATAKTWGGLK